MMGPILFIFITILLIVFIVGSFMVWRNRGMVEEETQGIEELYNYSIQPPEAKKMVEDVMSRQARAWRDMNPLDGGNKEYRQAAEAMEQALHAITRIQGDG